MNILLKIVFNEDTKLLIVAHKGAANAASIFNTGAAQFAAGVGKVAYALRVALYVALFGGLAYAQHDLPPLAAISRNGRPSVLYLFASLIFYQYLRAVAVSCCVGQGYATGVDDDAVLTAVNSSFIDDGALPPLKCFLIVIILK